MYNGEKENEERQLEGKGRGFQAIPVLDVAAGFWIAAAAEEEETAGSAEGPEEVEGSAHWLPPPPPLAAAPSVFEPEDAPASESRGKSTEFSDGRMLNSENENIIYEFLVICYYYLKYNFYKYF